MRVKVTFHNYSNMFRAGVISRGDAWERRSIVKVFKIALWAALRTIIRPKTHQIAGFCIYNLNFFSVGDTPDSRSGKGRRPPALIPGPSAWTQPPISAWLASVPVFMFYETTAGLQQEIPKRVPVLKLWQRNIEEWKRLDQRVTVFALVCG